MSKIYLVDSENIGASWTQLLPGVSEEDRMYVFYTDKSPYISYDNLLQVIAYCKIPVFCKCFEGKNALDFQLVSELGFMLCKDPEAEFLIVSDDYGYDAAVRYWTEKGYNAKRIGKRFCRPAGNRRTADAAADIHVIQEVQEAETASEAGYTEMQENAFEADAEEMLPEAVAVEENAESEAAKPEMPEPAVTESEPEVTESETADAGMLSSQAEEPELVQIPVMDAEETERKADVIPDTVTESADRVPDAEEVPQVSEATVKEDAAEAEEGGNAEVKETAEQTEKVQQPEVILQIQEVTQPAQELEKQPDISAQETGAPEETTKTEQQNRSRDRKRKPRKDPAKEASQDKVKKPEKAESRVSSDLVREKLLAITVKCESTETEKDADSVMDLFRTVKMSDLTTANTALKVLIGNELGNDIYREIKDDKECRTLLDSLYLPAMKERFMLYVKTVMDRSELQGHTPEKLGAFLLDIPRKNLNSIRSSMLKEFGHEQGNLIYTVFKPHMKVLNKI